MSVSFVPDIDDLDDDLPPSTNHVAEAPAPPLPPSAGPKVPNAGPKVPAKARFVLPRRHAGNCQPGNTLYLQVLGKWSHTMVIPPGYKPTSALTCQLPGVTQEEMSFKSVPSSVSTLHPLKSSPPAGPPAVARGVGLEARGTDGRVWVCAGDTSSGLFWFLPDGAPALARAAAAAQYSVVGTPVPSGFSGTTEFTFVVPLGGVAGQQIQVELGSRRFSATLPGLCVAGQTLTGRAPEPSSSPAEQEPVIKRAKGGAGPAEVPPTIDSKLWAGAEAAGWTLKQGHNYNWTYISPDGRKFSNRKTAQTFAGPLLGLGAAEAADLAAGEAPRDRGEEGEGLPEGILDWGDRVTVSR